MEACCGGVGGATACAVTARYSPGQHGSVDPDPVRQVVVRVTARYSPGQHGSDDRLLHARRLDLRHGPVFAGPAWKPVVGPCHAIRERGSRPGIRRASMEARVCLRPIPPSPCSHGPVFAGPAWKRGGRRRLRHGPHVTARYSPGQHGSMVSRESRMVSATSSRPGIRRASMEARRRR